MSEVRRCGGAQAAGPLIVRPSCHRSARGGRRVAPLEPQGCRLLGGSSDVVRTHAHRRGAALVAVLDGITVNS